MNRVHAAREVGQPQALPNKDAILRELHAILSSPQFCNSKRYPALLEYIVKNTLAGRADLLKERTLGVEVFSRQPTYDTNADTVVRYTAGEVRKRLLLYYSEHGRDSDIRISLPAGSYVPEFSSGDEPRAIETSPKPLVHEPELAIAQDAMSPASLVASSLASPLNARNTHKRHLWLIVATTTLLIAAAAGGVWWKHITRSPQSAFDAFWAPVLHDAAGDDMHG